MKTSYVVIYKKQIKAMSGPPMESLKTEETLFKTFEDAEKWVKKFSKKNKDCYDFNTCPVLSHEG